MIDPLTRQPMNGLTAPASNLSALQSPPQPGSAQSQQGVPAPQAPWANGPGDGSYGAPNDNLVGAYATAYQNMQPRPTPTGPMNGPPMPPHRPMGGPAPAPAMPMPPSNPALDPNALTPAMTQPNTTNDPNALTPALPPQGILTGDHSDRAEMGGYRPPMMGSPGWRGDDGPGPVMLDNKTDAAARDRQFGRGHIYSLAYKAQGLGKSRARQYMADALMNGPVADM